MASSRSVSYASAGADEKLVSYSKSMFTVRICTRGEGTLAPKRSWMPSLGWMRRTSSFGSSCSAAAYENGRCGTRLNWIATSVTRFGSRLPVRR